MNVNINHQVDSSDHHQEGLKSSILQVRNSDEIYFLMILPQFKKLRKLIRYTSCANFKNRCKFPIIGSVELKNFQRVYRQRCRIRKYKVECFEIYSWHWRCCIFCLHLSYKATASSSVVTSVNKKYDIYVM
jgi:hypothetical protein